MTARFLLCAARTADIQAHTHNTHVHVCTYRMNFTLVSSRSFFFQHLCAIGFEAVHTQYIHYQLAQFPHTKSI